MYCNTSGDEKVRDEISAFSQSKWMERSGGGRLRVVSRTHKLLDDYIPHFTSSGIRGYDIKRYKADEQGLEGIRAATMHRIKGLEFQYVFIAAANNRIIPLVSAIDYTDAVSERETMTAEKCLLYVALTRAQKGAHISG